VPNAVDLKTLKFTAIATTSATFTWGAVTGTFKEYYITITGSGTPKVDPVMVAKGKETKTLLKLLEPGKVYKVTIVTRIDGTTSSVKVTKEVTTSE
jgi:hypothetical protein